MQGRRQRKMAWKPRTELGCYIRARREALGLSIREMAKRMKKDHTYVREVERSASSMFRRSMASWAKALGCRPSDLQRFAGNPGYAKESPTELGRFVRRRRKELGLSLQQLAGHVGVTRQRMSQIEIDRGVVLSRGDTVRRMAQALRAETTTLKQLGWKEKCDQALHRMVHRPPERSTPLGTFLTCRRLELRLTQHQLASQVGIDRAMVNKLERGESRSVRSLRRLSRVLGPIPPQLLPLRRMLTLMTSDPDIPFLE